MPVLKIAVDNNERERVMELLRNEKLPVTDIKEDTLLYLLLDENEPVGTAGLDIFEDCALLRSISVAGERKRKGYGKILNEQIEEFARESGIQCLYLITHTAKDFFDKQGYCVIRREEAPEPIRQTDQFSSLCPSTAVVMKKRI